MKHSGIHHFSHLLVQFRHLWRVDVLGHVPSFKTMIQWVTDFKCLKCFLNVSCLAGLQALDTNHSTFKQAFDASHFLDHLRKLCVLGEQLLYIPGSHSRSPGHSLDAVRLFTEELGAILVVEFWVGKSTLCSLNRSSSELCLKFSKRVLQM